MAACALVAACAPDAPTAPVTSRSRPDGDAGAPSRDADAPPPRADGPPPWSDVSGARLGPLPPQASVASATFATNDHCSACHSAAEGSPALRDAKGRDVSPAALYRATMMALAARDPYYLAEVSHEIARRPAAAAAVERACTPCHAPEGAAALRGAGKHVTFDALTRGTTDDAHLAREGVGCTLCHQIAADGLGTAASFGGGFVLAADRTLYGPHENPVVGPMQFFVSYTPARGEHITRSELCATCHTVTTRALDGSGRPVGPPFLEQAPYLEWLASQYGDGAPEFPRASCISCHAPTVDEDGAPIRAPIARPPNAAVTARSPLGRHVFVGGNAYMLRVMREAGAWLGALAPPEALAAQATLDEAHLGRAATLAVERVAREGSALVFVVRVSNEAGHKLPTGYPSRRAWLHVRVRQGDVTAFESGGHDAFGRIVDRQGRWLDAPGRVLPHLDVVTREDQVQVYEAVPGDASGAVARAPLDAVAYLKDNRLLPRGFSAAHPSAAAVAPVGVSGDTSFGSEDRVTYRIPAPSGPVDVEVELLFQPVRPSDLAPLAEGATDASRRFLDMVRGEPPTPTVLARAAASAK